MAQVSFRSPCSYSRRKGHVGGWPHTLPFTLVAQNGPEWPAPGPVLVPLAIWKIGQLSGKWPSPGPLKRWLSPVPRYDNTGKWPKMARISKNSPRGTLVAMPGSARLASRYFLTAAENRHAGIIHAMALTGQDESFGNACRSPLHPGPWPLAQVDNARPFCCNTPNLQSSPNDKKEI